MDNICNNLIQKFESDLRKMVSCKWLLNFTRNCAKCCPTQTKKKIISEEAYKNFVNSLPVIVNKGVMDTRFLETDELRQRMIRIAEYYMRGRKTIQGEMVILSHEILRKSEGINEQLKNQEYVLAWCVELLMSYILILDDIEDGAKTRNGKVCWHLLPDVGSLAGNDASMLRSFIFNLLEQNFKGDLFVNLVKLFNEAFFTCNVGQYMDAITSKYRNYSNFTMEYYKKIALYKYAYYSSKFPILSALILSNNYNNDSCQNVDNIFTDVGIWSQINNDFTDYFDDDTRTGKSGTDIQAGKCTWLAVTALERCNDTQRRVFEECYGSWEPENVDRIRKIYEELDVVNIYYRAEQSTYDKVMQKIKSLPANVTPSAEFMSTMLDKYYPNVVCGKKFKFVNKE